MSNEDLKKNGISKNITKKGDTVYKYGAGGISFNKVAEAARRAKINR